MKLIPVLDLMHGKVVHARHGDRQQYRPIQSALCDSSHAQDILSVMLELYRFDTVYMADLDAIMGESAQSQHIAQLQQQFPQLRFMVDAGFQNPQTVLDYPCAIQPVIGSEVIHNLKQWHALYETLGEDIVLSLDFRAGQFLGCAGLWQNPTLWPHTLIAMSLSHVGSSDGPDWTLLEKCMQQKSQSNWIAAGGIHTAQHWQKLSAMGIYAGLVATALHQMDCQITKDG